MKTIYLIGWVIIFFFISCDENYFNIPNPNDFSADSFWSNEDDIQQGLIATYGVLQYDGLLGGLAAMSLPVRSDLGRPNLWNANVIGLNQMAFNENTDIVRARWQSCYIGIYRANQVLANKDKIEKLDNATKIQIEAEARFLRGFFYYSLYQGYNGGSVILHTLVPETQDDFYKSPSPAEEVYQLILSDLEFAEANLPISYSKSSDLGRATWGAAAAMLGKLHINEHNYEEAKKYFKEIIDSDIYQLASNIGHNFDEFHEFNSESIFEVAFSIDAKPGTSGNAKDGPTGSEATNRVSYLGTPAGKGYGTVMPSVWLTTLFMNDTMDVSNPINVDRTGNAKYSIRTSVSITIADDDNTTNYQKSSLDGSLPLNRNNCSYVKKFQNWTWELENDYRNSGINERVIRLADVMLLYAECLLKTGGSFKEALALVNEIRTRAGVVLLDESDFDETSFMEHIMWVERPLELMFEGHDIRWEDLRRWGKIKEQYERLSSIDYIWDGTNKLVYIYDPIKHKRLGTNTFKEFVEAAAIYDPAYHNYFPIPSTETNSNPQLWEDE